ncbi:EAL domain-containing protein [Accumulibacter sp.]|uniref:EAL domain-containing protein n=1 Tax=Accumulibacter sp. TaxID=2053492 RepID=UPI0025D73086|nr:EAL domain-containing protein [Accumulibacter sp.]MCM8595451.1 EAL domain-containing protein [Accumulibacter sp.]MDS4049598.1 EAL domain-containing protein [Accumulibacter sp.]
MTSRLRRFAGGLLVSLVLLLAGVPATAARPAVLTVAIDDNYPPFVYRDGDGGLAGYLVDLWDLWARKTGVRVKLLGSDWLVAQQRIADRQAEVIDTVFRTPSREQTLDFSPPYEKIPVSIYTHSSVGGIVDLATLRGFLVGAKAGDACVERLAGGGIHTVETFPSYESLVAAALEGSVRVFCLDDPPARYLLYRKNAEQVFNRAFILYTGEFHRAVRKGDEQTMALLSEGFASIGADEERALRDKWMGTSLTSLPLARHLGYALLAGSVIGMLLLLWVLTLRRVVRQRTEQLAATLGAIPDLIFEVGLDGRYYAYHSPKSEVLLGVSLDELIGRRLSEFLPPEAATVCFEALNEAHEHGHSVGRQVRLRLPDGRHWFELSIARKAARRGDGPRFITLVRDITERKSAEARLRMATQATQLVFWELDIANDRLRYDATMLQLLGLAHGEGPADSGELMELVHPDDRAALIERFREALRPGDAVFGFEHQIVNRAGEGIWLQTRGRVAQRDASGRAVLAVGTAMNISERKKAEEALLRRSQQLEMLSGATQEINRELDIPVVLSGLVDSALKITGATGGGAGRLENGEIVFDEYRRGERLLAVDYRFPPGRGVPGRVLQTRQFHLSNDAAHDPLVIPEVRQAVGFGNLLDVPIVNRRGELLGCLEIHDKPGGFDETDVCLLQGLAASAAIALENTALLAARRKAAQALRESEALKASVLASAACGIVATDRAGMITVFNPCAEAILGYRSDEVVGKVTPEIFHDAGEVVAMARQVPGTSGEPKAAGFAALVYKVRTTGVTDQREVTLVRRDGRRIAARLAVTVMRDAQGQIDGYLGTVVDISAEKAAAEQLRLAAKVFEQGGEGIAITDAAYRIVMVNQAFVRITGYSAEEALGSNPRLLASGRHDRSFYQAMWAAIEAQGHWQGEIWNRRKDGSVYPEWLSISRVQSEGVTTHYIGTFIDITQHKEAEASIQRLAHYDPLTGLPNRSLLDERFRHDLSRAHRGREPLALMFLDLDRFKNINDSLGHRVGDELLIQVGQRLRHAIRDEDTVSRLGGDEFILVLPKTDADGAAHVAAKLLEITAPPYRIEQHELTVTASVGIAMYPADGDSFEVLSMCADTAMYRAKQSGRNGYCFFTAEMQERSARMLQIENDLRRALDNDELRLHFQPQFAIADRRLVGAEALLRWQHPELGTVPPAEFVPIAEESGLILPIGEWVLRTAVRQLRIWQRAGLPLASVAVNLSAVQFRQASLTQMVSRILDEEELSAGCLELELTESVAMDNPLAAIETMDKLRERGVRMSIDDFGTDYSSMSYLKRFRVHKLKIDRSFVADLSTDPDDEAIVSAMISLAHNLGLQTIAEGVESEAQLAFLRARGCDEAQGYLFGPPMTADRFGAFLRSVAVETPGG